ncbi:ceramide glucosyltransferase [Mongoliimonas terrestris]|uniref:ceramide glucosyltransferase n=1 Tax=Mongoliimonas terrestris TaxID=1709001 RepID=UPI0009FA02FC|nr:ceramide glucosyltransferase [Mongoliimonas terrestris]
MGILAAFCVFALAVHLASLTAAGIKAKARRRPTAVSGGRPPVTVLRPVCGLENNVEATLGSTFDLAYPDYEIVFCAATVDDPVLPLVRRLIAAHPERPARLLVGDDRISQNPKLNNVVKGWAAARHDWIAMVDSNVLMAPDFIDRSLERWTDGTGLVCSPPIGIAPDGFFAELECAWLNAFQARWQLVADMAGFGFAQGKSMMWNRPMLDRAGGIARLAAEVAEDAAATKIVRGAGLSVRLVDRPYPQPLGRRTAGEVWRRQLRWARLRRASFPLFFAPEILAGGALPMAGAVTLGTLGFWDGSTVAAFAALWYGAEMILNRVSGWPNTAHGLTAMLVRDLALPVLWLAALTGNGFVWRGNAMSVSDPAPGRLVATRQRVKARIRELADSFR